MVHYNLSTENWEEKRIRYLQISLETLLMKEGYSNGFSPRTLQGTDVHIPYIELEDNRIRIRKLTYLTEEKQRDLIKKADEIYVKIKEMSSENLDNGLKLSEGFKTFFEKKNDGLVYTPCKKCGKSPRVDYKGYCMDCADELGISELFQKENKERIMELLTKIKNNENNPNLQKLLGFSKEKFDIERLYQFYDVPPVDRLKNYQTLINFIKSRDTLSQFVSDVFLDPVINCEEEKRKTYAIDDDLAEKISKRKNYPETLLPFPAVIIDCALPIRNRFYFSFICGRYYIDRPYVSYVGIITCYVEKVGDGYIMNQQILTLEKEKQKIVFNVKDDGYNKQIRNFVSGVLNFIHEPDVEEIEHTLNPKNNQRRIERGRTPLPAFSIIKITGKKKIYMERHNKLPSQPKTFQFQQDVPATYIHFRNKKRYKKLYEMTEEELTKKGYSIYKDVIRKVRCEFVRFKGLPRRNIAYVLENENSHKFKVKKVNPQEITQ